jgi:hypothetical protein
VYPSEWKLQLKVPNYLSILSVVLCLFLLVSFAVLPPEASHRHYLSVGLLFPVLFISLSFVIPAGSDPPLCFDDITPHDMRSSLSCAWTGTLVALGGLGSVVWVFLRSLWLHIRIFWDRDPGAAFKYLSLLAGMVVPLSLLTALLAATGFSYRMGQTCLPNHEHAIVSFWVWLVGFAIAGFVLQAVTTGYCVFVYFRSLRRQQQQERLSSPRRSQATTTTTTTTATAAQSWKNVKRLFLLQWRNILVSVFVIVGSISFFIVFWSQDAKLGRIFNDPDDLTPVKIWITCLTLSSGDKDSCRKYVGDFTVPRGTVLASLILASLVGIELFILLARRSMFAAWRNLLLRRPLSRFRRPATPELTSLENPPTQLSPVPLKEAPSSSSSTYDERRNHVPLPATRPSTARVASDARLLSPQGSAYASAAPSVEPSPLPSPSIQDEAISFVPHRSAPIPPQRSRTAPTQHSRRAVPRISAPVPGSFMHVSSAFPPGNELSGLRMNPLWGEDNIEQDNGRL